MTKNLKIRKNVRLIHKWLGLILGIQLLFWVSGGVVMSNLSLEKVRGEDRMLEQGEIALNTEDFSYPITQVMLSHPGVHKITADYWLEKPVYRVSFEQQQLLIDASTGKRLSPVTPQQASLVAVKDYSIQISILAVNEIKNPSGEVRGREGELWQVVLADERNTRIYVSKSTGNVVARRNDMWRLFDFFWMLHIMDYENRNDFNHLLLRTFSISGLLFVISGLWLFLYSFKRREFSWIIGVKKTDPDQHS